MDGDKRAIALLMQVVNRRGPDGEHVYDNDDFKRALPLLIHILGADRDSLSPSIQRALDTRPPGPPPASLIRELQEAVAREGSLMPSDPS